MITARIESIGREFATFEDYDDVTPKFFHEHQSVWVRCDNDAPNINKIESISEQTQGSMSLKTIVLRDALSCNGASLLSNHPLQEQRWKSRKPDPSELLAIQKQLNFRETPKAVTILSETQGTLFLVYDDKIQAVYNTVGYRLLDAKFNEISATNAGVDLIPLIDLDDDGVPEFFARSTDSVDAYMIKLFPKSSFAVEIKK
jgi:hypothetical protein